MTSQKFLFLTTGGAFDFQLPAALARWIKKNIKVETEHCEICRNTNKKFKLLELSKDEVLCLDSELKVARTFSVN